MIVDTDSIFSLTEVNHNFAPLRRVVDEKGKAVIFKHNKPKYFVVAIDQLSEKEIAELEKYHKENF